MAKPIVKTWTGVMRYPSKAPVRPSDEPNQKLIDDTLIGLLHDLQAHLKGLLHLCDLTLNLVESDRNRRLERGINESGLIAPDYGKTFTGIYFESLQVTLKTPKGTKKKTIAFLQLYVEGLIMTYFMKHPRVASNWENSFRNPNGGRIATTSSPSTMINFPSIALKVS